MIDNIIVGKYTLESLTTGMYNDPFIIFREYIQNSVDAIDEAISNNILSQEEGCISVKINKKNKSIAIEDNGIGISVKNAYKILTDIGNSKKKVTKYRGFRGIGRLGGLSYCQSVCFETSIKGEAKKTIVSFDGNKLNELLIPGKYENYDIIDVIKQITSLKYEDEDIDLHYFKVNLNNVENKFKLLEVEKVEDYLVQVAPLPFNINKFQAAIELNEKLTELGIKENSYSIYLHSEDGKAKKLYKPYKTRFLADINKKIKDIINGIEIIEVRDNYRNKLIGLVWYGKCNLYGTVLDKNVKGLRIRKSGILVGNRFTLNNLFKEERFNGWLQGEVIILDEKIIPNARRDDFEKNEEYLYLINELSIIIQDIYNMIRKTSRERNKQKQKGKNSTKKSNYSKKVNNLNKTDDLIEKMDILIDKVTSNEDLLNKVIKIVDTELESKKSEIIIKKIQDLIP